MDEIDRKILNMVQEEISICSHPFHGVADTLGLSETEVIERLKRLKREGIIRRIGAVLDPRSLGWVSTLCAARVPDDMIDEFVSIVNQFSGVTHNYERNAYYNIWFTLTAPSWEKVGEILKDISVRTGIQEIVHLPAREIFKVKVQFDL